MGVDAKKRAAHKDAAKKVRDAKQKPGGASSGDNWSSRFLLPIRHGFELTLPLGQFPFD